MMLQTILYLFFLLTFEVKRRIETGRREVEIKTTAEVYPSSTPTCICPCARSELGTVVNFIITIETDSFIPSDYV